ncbi:hypothetical protein NKH09_15910 [Mesorhizobium sp. M1339]|uniref:alpha-glutamyl/putrescinyl thymine pyrophosphorylase clade 3 protein n=1 Tax=Mesorhizobium sp. M1339 TaxID=2957086 RepID=UPI00333BDE0C
MNLRDQARARQIGQRIETFSKEVRPLSGLVDAAHVEALALQLVDSLRRVEFAHHIRDAEHSPQRADPTSVLFDPLRAAVIFNRRGEHPEAWWLVFLATHFGKHHVDGWRLARDIYGRFNGENRWDWATVSADPVAFRAWLAANGERLRGADGISRRFSNHRKYESLRADSPKGTATVFSSYVAWIAPPRLPTDIVRHTHQQVGQNPHDAFASLYQAMDPVQRFGRLGKFDFLAMLGKLGIAPIEPGTTFLKNATGPLAGARLLVGGARNAKLDANDLEATLSTFGAAIRIGAQPMEDAICNWQKRPNAYVRFRG